MNQNLSSYRIFIQLQTPEISQKLQRSFISASLRSVNPSRSWRKALAANFFPEVPAALF